MPIIRHLTLGRNFDEVGAAADQVRVWVSDWLDDEGVAAVELALVEALTNAIRHGTSDSAKLIRVFIEMSNEQVGVEIEDSSPPMPSLFADAGADKIDFDPNDIENIPEGGRGLSLIVMGLLDWLWIRATHKRGNDFQEASA